ncbi:PQQ-dependent sugar dehydrogenase [Segnochrobactrum spirostomi]|nr:PQQ-dependent sugar dehydrogenase [Segnochrobactrum spirostomi]
MTGLVQPETPRSPARPRQRLAQRCAIIPRDRAAFVAATVLAAALMSPLAPAAAQSAAPLAATSRDYKLAVTKVVGGLVHPWSLAFLPDGAMLVTERPGRLRLIENGKLDPEPVAGLPAVFAQGQGGLLDLALDPDFAKTGLVYFSYAEPRQGGAGTTLARGQLVREGGKARLENVEVIFRQEPALPGGIQFGSRFAIASNGTLYVTLGDRRQADLAQKLDNDVGKVIRIDRDGSIPKSNPFVGRDGARPEIWAYGFRNGQGAAIDPATGQLWTVDHGAKGGDEINHPEAGKNYGWPVITYGVDYSGAKIGIGTSAPGMEQPVYYWDPSIAPSGLAIYDGALFPKWKGDLLVGALKGQILVRLDRENGRIVDEERMMKGLIGRIRDVRVGPDGAIWLLTDEENGGLYRVIPAKS